MAVTKIWKINGWLADSLIYIENPEKTANPMTIGNPHMTREQYERLEDLIDYEENRMLSDQQDEDYRYKEHFVTGVNCNADRARQEMMHTKEAFGKADGICAYHAIQSFKPGEVSPSVAHKIGIELAEKMWGDGFQILVATHVDHDHIHTHFIVNSVSYLDGHRLWKEKNYWKLRSVSDSICRSYGLSLINPKSRGQQYAEWNAKKKGMPTFRQIIKSDIDREIKASDSIHTLYDRLRKLGYVVQTERTYTTVKPPGAASSFRLRSLGDGYTEDDLEMRLARYRLHPELRNTAEQKTHYTVFKMPRKKAHGIRALYYKYLYLLGVFKKKSPVVRSSAFVEERWRLDENIREFNYLRENKISTEKDLLDRREMVQEEIIQISDDLKSVKNDFKRLNGDPKMAEEILNNIEALEKELKEKRGEAQLCGRILARQETIRSEISKEHNILKQEGSTKNGRRYGSTIDNRRDNPDAARKQGNHRSYYRTYKVQ